MKKTIIIIEQYTEGDSAGCFVFSTETETERFNAFGDKDHELVEYPEIYGTLPQCLEGIQYYLNTEKE